MKAYEIREKLREGERTVIFKKKNGEIRTMRCTLEPGKIPEVYGSALPSDTLITVWDVEMGGWRSFNLASVIEFK
jgi:hypothetical protein